MDQPSFLFPEPRATSRAVERPSAEQAARPPELTWTVSGLVAAVQRRLERDFADVRVEGEISNLRPAGSGHVYFTLREQEAQISAVMFRTRARLLPFRLEDGLRVLLRGRVSVYESRGQLQIIADSAEPVGDGARRLAFEQLKAKLTTEGLFATERKRPLPQFPRCIGIITSAQGAVIHDFWRVISRRYSGSRVLLFPAAVQGSTAAAELRAGLRWFSQNTGEADLVVLARGGGSFEDLDAFNDEQLARDIAASPLPVVSAVGHETDFTIADFVADLRAPTPSAAAELITARQFEVAEQLHLLSLRLHRATRYRIGLDRERLARVLASSGFAAAREFTFRRQQRLDDMIHRAAQAQRQRLAGAKHRIANCALRLASRDVKSQIAREKTRLGSAESGLQRSIRALLFEWRSRVESSRAQLTALSPQAVMERGYALVYRADGALLRSTADAAPGATITAQIADGRIRAEVLTTEESRT